MSSLIHNVTQDRFVKRAIAYMIAFVLLGVIFSVLFELDLDFSGILGPIIINLP